MENTKDLRPPFVALSTNFSVIIVLYIGTIYDMNFIFSMLFAGALAATLTKIVNYLPFFKKKISPKLNTLLLSFNFIFIILSFILLEI